MARSSFGKRDSADGQWRGESDDGHWAKLFRRHDDDDDRRRHRNDDDEHGPKKFRGHDDDDDRDPDFDPEDFVAKIDNPYLPLTPGTTFVYEGETEDGLAVNTVTVTHNTVEILGVTCIEVLDVATLDGVLTERTLDWYAQDDDGNVWYFGELSKRYEDGEFVDTEGSWKAGVDGALPGIVMKADPEKGDVYSQEVAPGVAEDKAKVLTDEASEEVPYGAFEGDVLKTKEFSPIEPDLLEHKFYALGVGNILAVDLNTGEREELVEIRVEGRAGNDVLNGLAGGDIVLGKAGRDVLDGRAGSDSLTGGADADTFVFKNLRDHVQDIDVVTDYSSSQHDRIDLPRGAKSIASETFDGGVWKLTLKGDGDVIELAGVSDSDHDGHIADDLFIV